MIGRAALSRPGELVEPRLRHHQRRRRAPSPTNWGGGWSPYDETEFPNRESDRKQERRGGRSRMAAGHNRCWFAGRVLEYGLTVDPPERDALDAMLKRCHIERSATARPTGAVPMRPDAQLLLFDPDAPPARSGTSTASTPAAPWARFQAQFRRSARWWASRSATARTAGAGRTAALTPRPTRPRRRRRQ